MLHHRHVRGRAARAAARAGSAAADGFRLVAAMNPFDAVGTARISAAVYDRTCRIAMGYQSGGRRGRDRRAARPASPRAWRAKVVELDPPDPRRTPTSGSGRRCAARSTWSRSRRSLAGRAGLRDRRTGTSAWTRPLVALSGPDPAGRVVRLPPPRTSSASCTTACSAPTRASAAARGGEAVSPGEAPARLQRAANGWTGHGARTRPHGPAQELARRHPQFAEVSPEVGRLDEAALDAAVRAEPGRGAGDARRHRCRHRRGAARAGAAARRPRLVLDRAPHRSGTPTGVGALRGVPADRGGDLDLDRSLEAVADARATAGRRAGRADGARLGPARARALPAGRHLRARWAASGSRRPR